MGKRSIVVAELVSLCERAATSDLPGLIDPNATVTGYPFWPLGDGKNQAPCFVAAKQEEEGSQSYQSHNNRLLQLNYFAGSVFVCSLPSNISLAGVWFQDNSVFHLSLLGLPLSKNCLWKMFEAKLIQRLKHELLGFRHLKKWILIGLSMIILRLFDVSSLTLVCLFCLGQ